MEVLQSQDAQRILEAALLCAPQPMSVRDMRALFDDMVSPDSVREMLARIQTDWQDKGVMLCELASGWRFQTRADVQIHLDRLHPEKPPKYSRATLETLAIIAYKQPVTRGDIEDIRGVTVSANIVKQLEDRGWVEVIGHRDAPGRPALFATTRHFLDDLGLSSLSQLPALDGLPVGQALLPGLEAEADLAESDIATSEATNIDASDVDVLPNDVPDSLPSLAVEPHAPLAPDLAPDPAPLAPPAP